MIFEVPLLIQPRVDAERQSTLYAVRPLFFESPEVEDRDLGRATRRLEQALRDQLGALAHAGDHQRLAGYSFSPLVTLHWLDLRLELQRGMQRCQVTLFTFEQHGRGIAFSPYLDDVWFEWEAKSDLGARAVEVLTRYFRDQERRRDTAELTRQLDRLQSKRRPWLSVTELDIDTRLRAERPEHRPSAWLGDSEPADGAEELRRVGRSLSELYPDELTRAFQRDDLVETLSALLTAPENRPLLLVGGPLVGKTTLIHEAVFRDMARRSQQQAKSRPKSRQVWHVTPQRIVTGMSFVGQWENRWLAILRHARKRHHILYFDDLLALFHAGITSQSNLSAADILKPYVERGEVRILAEMTSEQMRVFRERDRGFCDLFHTIPVEEPDEEATLRVLLSVIRAMEARFRARFDLEVLPTVLDLARRHQPEAAFPGKAAAWLQQLALKYQGRDIQRNDVIAEFRAKSGLQPAFVDTRSQLPRDEIVAGVQSRIVGQQHAVEAMAEVVSIAKARLNDPQRPLGSLFFLGPTGVGKTECAKALARYMFADESRLLRFDMNEYVGADAAVRLVGSSAQPEGLLTGAVRRQPFCVLLFDEIEKAHGDVFDVLLQILGEARLTDALGRTADFSNAVVILTSNLGTSESSRELGFGEGNAAASNHVYYKAVQDFFRPEFFNRLDRIVPFQRLSRAELERIARTIVDEVTSRQGLARRKCVVDITTPALDWVIDRGYEPHLGARAMRRSVEHEFVAPLARQLTGVLPETPTVLEVSRQATGLAVHVTPLAQSPPWPGTERPSLTESDGDLLGKARQAVQRIMELIEARRPTGEMSVQRLSPEFAWHLGLLEMAKDTRGLLRMLTETVASRTSRTAVTALAARPARKNKKMAFRGCSRERQVLKELCAAEDIREFCGELAAERRPSASLENLAGDWLELLDRLALLEALRPDQEGWCRQRVLLLIRCPDTEPRARRDFTRRLLRDFSWRAGTRAMNDSQTDDFDGVEFGLECAQWLPVSSADQPPREEDICCIQGPSGARHDVDAVVLEGCHASQLTQLQQGTHLAVTPDGRLHAYQVITATLTPEQSAERALHECLVHDESSRDSLGSAQTRTGSGPFSWQPAVSLADASTGLDIDFRYERALAAGWDRLSRLLPLPPEFQDA